MPRIRCPTVLLCGAMSLAVHAAIALGALRAGGRAAPPVFAPDAATLAGESIDVDPPPPPEDDAVEGESVATSGAAPLPGPGPKDRQAIRGVRTAHSAADRPSPAAPPAMYGAVGVRFATDLATTFTRAFPQAASADAIWASVPFGNGGMAEVTLVLDADGHLAASTVAGSPSPALKAGIERTLALLGPRSFTARGAITKLRVTARVGRDDVHDGLHGDVFALSGGSFSGDIGAAFFALPPSGGPGRRVDVELRLLP